MAVILGLELDVPFVFALLVLVSVEFLFVFEEIKPGLFPDPVLLIEFATELREAPELDLLRFSFELVGLVLLYRGERAELFVLVGLLRLLVESEGLIVTPDGLLVPLLLSPFDF